MSSIRRLCSRLERSLLSCSSWISHDVCVFEPALCDHIFIISSNWDMKEEASIVFFPLGFSSVFHFYFCFIHLNLFGCEFPAKTSGKNCDVNHPKTSWNSQPMRIGLLPPAPAFLFFSSFILPIFHSLVHNHVCGGEGGAALGFTDVLCLESG